MPDGVQVRARPISIALPQIKLAFVVLVVILLLAVVTRFIGVGFEGRLDIPSDFYFDEVYFAKTGQEILHGDPKAWEFYGHENTHPPLSKLFMAGGMFLFGENSFGWRFFGAFAGVGSVLFIYLLAHRLFNSEIAGLAAALLLTCEGLALAQSRIATPDTYVLFFILGCVYFLITKRFVFSGIFFGAAVASKWIAGLTGIPIILYLVWVLATRLRETRSEREFKWFEFALPVGLGVTYAGITLFVYTYLATPPDTTYSPTQGPLEIASFGLMLAGLLSIASSLIGLLSAYLAKRSLHFSSQGRLCLKIALVFGVCFMLIPACVYLITYAPMLLNPPSTEAMGNTGWHGLGQVIRQNRMAFDFHSHLNAPHPYSSPWDEWPIMARPVYLYAGDGNAKIYSLGNPVIFWSALPALAFAIWQGLAFIRARLGEGVTLFIWGRIPRSRAAPLFVALVYLGFWVPMGLISRVLFIYHYLPALAFAILALAYSVDWLWRQGTLWGRCVSGGLLIIAVLTFAFFYPHLTAIPVPAWLDELYYPFDRGNLLDNDLFNWE